MVVQLLLLELNNLSSLEFSNLFHNIVECYPDVGKRLESLRPFENIEQIIQEAKLILEDLDFGEKLKILQLHPDLAGKLAEEEQLTPESLREQAAAGLSTINNEEKTVLRTLNEKYFNKFGFPFVICARENKFQSILQGIKTRLHNSRNDEVNIGIEEVKKICRLRILELVKE